MGVDRKKKKKMERKYKCPYCFKTYAEEWALKNHVKVCNLNVEKHKEQNKDGNKNKVV